jgi:hypothetical protein
MSGRTWGGSLDYTSARHERVQASRPAIDFGYHRVHGFFVTYVTLNNGKRLLQRWASFAAITTISKPSWRRKRAADIARSTGHQCNPVVFLRRYLEILCYNKREHFHSLTGLEQRVS